MQRVHAIIGLLLAFGAVLPADAIDNDRKRLAEERQALTERFRAEEAECQQRFVVTPCVNDVRSRRREALAPLRARELDLDDKQRRERAQQRQAAREARLARAPKPAVAEPGARVASPSPSNAPPEPRVPPPMRKRTAGEADERAVQAAERAKALQRRAQDMQQTQDKIARKVLEREASGKRAAPLPTPDIASAPRR